MLAEGDLEGSKGRHNFTFTHLLVNLLPLLLAAWLYLPAVRLPFFWDDVVHLRYVSDVSARDILTDPYRVGYYRPLVNLLLHLPFTLNSRPSAPLWHMLLIWNHLINVALVRALCRHLHLGKNAAFFAMLIFAVFPFNFQAVIWVLAWFHPLVTSLVLLACIAALRYFRNPRRLGMLLLAWLVGGVAPFVHENGVLTGVMVVWVIMFANQRGRLHEPPLRKKLFLLLVPFALATATYVGLLIGLEVFGTGERATWSDRGFNAAYFVQGLSFPTQFIAGHFSDRQSAVWLAAGGLALLIIFQFYRDLAARRCLIFGAGWFVLASAPAAMLLTQNYVTNAPRLMYLASVGAAMGYGVVVEKLLPHPKPLPVNREGLSSSLLPPPRLRGGGQGEGSKTGLSLLFAGLLAVSLLLSAHFVRGRLDLHLALGEGYRQLDDLLAQDPTGRRDSLLINAPIWADSEKRTFPLGKMGAIFITDYFGVHDFVWANTGVDYTTLESVYFYPVLENWRGHLSGLKGIYMIDWGTLQGYIRPHDWIYLFGVEDNHFRARLVGQHATPVATLLGDFDTSVRLSEVQSTLKPDGTVEVVLRWQRLSDQIIPYDLFVHLVCGDSIIDQSDGSPLGNLYAFNVWEVGEIWQDYYVLQAGEADPSCLGLRVGLYDPITGARAPLNSRLPTQGEGYLLFPVGK